MAKPAIPVNETARLMSLHAMRILDTPEEERYDRITRMAKRVFGVPICLISLVDSNRQWFKSKQGLEACETNREVSFCGHAITDESILVVPDANLDPRFKDNPLVTEAPFIRFYAGCPIRNGAGHRIGTVCIIDRKPRDFPDEDHATLRDFAAMVEDELRAASQATVDELTQIANRRGFNSVATHILELCRRTDIEAELVLFDLDNFKEINDTLGHAAGDLVLQYFSKLLIKNFRGADVVARLGGDEFGVLMTAPSQPRERALSRLNEMAATTDCPIRQKLAWSMGTITFDPARHANIESLLAEGDAEMYANKIKRRNARAGSGT